MPFLKERHSTKRASEEDANRDLLEAPSISCYVIALEVIQQIRAGSFKVIEDSSESKSRGESGSRS